MTETELGGAPEEIAGNPKAPKSKKKLFIALGAVAGLLVIGAAITGVALAANAAKEAAQAAEAAAAAERNELRNAAHKCVEDHTTYSLMDGGQSLVLSDVGKYYGADYDEVICVLDRVGAPGSTETKIGNTRALDGTKDASWDGYYAEWTYHPDDGLNILIEKESTD